MNPCISVAKIEACYGFHTWRQYNASHIWNTNYLYTFTFSYGTAKKKRPGYLVGNLVATNWPIEKALHAIGYNQIPTK